MAVRRRHSRSHGVRLMSSGPGRCGVAGARPVRNSCLGQARGCVHPFGCSRGRLLREHGAGSRAGSVPALRSPKVPRKRRHQFTSGLRSAHDPLGCRRAATLTLARECLRSAGRGSVPTSLPGGQLHRADMRAVPGLPAGLPPGLWTRHGPIATDRDRHFGSTPSPAASRPMCAARGADGCGRRGRCWR
jgi:hypothetical protein